MQPLTVKDLMVPKNFATMTVRLIEAGASDHYPVVAVFDARS